MDSDNDPFAAFRGRHAGMPAAILGAGPSLAEVEARHLAGCVVFVVNSAAVKFPALNDYYVATDPHVTLYQHWDDLADQRCHLFLNRSSGFSNPPVDASRVTWFRRRKERAARRLSRSDIEIIWGTSAAHVAAHIAWIMGCGPLILLGCEGRWHGNVSHYLNLPGQPSDPVVRNISNWAEYAERVRTDAALAGGLLAPVRDEWKHLAVENRHVRFLNASGGDLPPIKRISLDDLPNVLAAR